METNGNIKSTGKAQKVILDFFKQHRKGSTVLFGVIIGSFVIAAIGVIIKNSIEENRNYYISVNKENTFDCNANYDEKAKILSCEERQINGEFSDYETTKIDGYVTLSVEGNKFIFTPYNTVQKSDYEVDGELDFEKIENHLSESYRVYIKNNYLNKRFAEIAISVRYKLSEADKALISKKQNDWKKWKENEDAKTKTESETKEQDQKKEEETETNTTTTEEHSYLDALRKCTVMEAADIYTTGIGKKSNNVFNDARDTCNAWYSQWGENDFFEAAYSDWENRKNEKIDGQPLTHYLTILGW